MHSRAVIRLRLENDLRRELERNEFRVFYQPIISIQSGRLSGFEALVRWQHPERGLVAPSEFIPIAEETGMVVTLGSWILEESCRQLHEWHQIHPTNRSLTINVNLSSKQLLQAGLVQEVKLILEKTQLPARNLKLEITESVVMENAESAATMPAISIKRSLVHDLARLFTDTCTGSVDTPKSTALSLTDQRRTRTLRSCARRNPGAEPQDGDRGGRR